MNILDSMHRFLIVVLLLTLTFGSSISAMAQGKDENVESVNPVNHRPRRTACGEYLANFWQKMGETKTCHMPIKSNEKLSGDLLIYFSIDKNGAINRQNGGLKVLKSSGHNEIDNAALTMIKRAAPFDLPTSCSSNNTNARELTVRFNFRKEDADSSNIDCMTIDARP